MTLADLVINDKGFNMLGFNDIEELLQIKARKLMGEDIDLRDESPLGQWVSLLAYDGVEFLELLQQIYLANDIDAASGDALTMLTKAIGVVRLQPSKSRGNVTFSIDPNTIIPKDFVVQTAEGFQYVTDNASTSSGNSVTTAVTAVLAGGEGNALAGEVNVIGNPQAGVKSVTNSAAFEGGSNKETDQSLRSRYYVSLSANGSGTADSIRSILLSVAGVRAARVIENDTEETVKGNPPKSFHPYVLGGDEQAIADAIRSKKPLGIKSYGSIVKESYDKGKNKYDIGFSRPNSVPVKVDISILTSTSFESESEAQIKDNVIAYIGGTDSKGNFYQGLSLGDDVIAYMVILAAGVAGVTDVNVKMARDEEALKDGNVIIDDFEVAITNISEVNINVR